MPQTENDDQHLHKRSRQELLSFRKGAIIYLFEVCLDYPDPSEDAETVENIRSRLSIPRDQAYIIKTVIDKCRDRASNPKITKSSRGRPKLLAEKVWVLMYHEKRRGGCSKESAAAYVNRFRDEYGLPTVSAKTYQKAADEDLQEKMKATLKLKAGSHDEDSAWAQARYMFAKQLCVQFFGSRELCEEYGVNPLSIYQILWVRSCVWCVSDRLVAHLLFSTQVDEKHRKVLLGALKDAYPVIPTDEHGEFLPVKEGGQYHPRKRTTVKYPGEGRMAFGVAVTVREINGKLQRVAERMR